jgi:hypothetical protein
MRVERRGLAGEVAGGEGGRCAQDEPAIVGSGIFRHRRRWHDAVTQR